VAQVVARTFKSGRGNIQVSTQKVPKKNSKGQNEKPGQTGEAGKVLKTLTKGGRMVTNKRRKGEDNKKSHLKIEHRRF